MALCPECITTIVETLSTPVNARGSSACESYTANLAGIKVTAAPQRNELVIELLIREARISARANEN